MNSKSKKWAVGLSVLAACTAGTLSASAQTFDTPPSDFQLPLPPGAQFSFIGATPTTLNIGNFDSSVKSTVTGADLNDVAVAGIPGITSIANGGTGTVTHRIWTIVHDSGSDTRSLTQTDPSDIVVTVDPRDPDLFYILPSSLEILDLDGDGQNDLALADSLDFLSTGATGLGNDKPNSPARIIGIPGQASAPFFATSLNLLGQQMDGASLPTPFIIGGFSQPVLAAGDFDGDGETDLAFYDFEAMNDDDLAAVLVNNGTVGILPKSDTILNTPIDVGNVNGGYNVAAADIDGDGITDLAMTFVVPNDDEPGPGRVLAFLGNGDGTFNGEPVVDVLISDQADLHGLVIGDFDGNSFLDFAVSNLTDTDTSTGATQVAVVLCAPGSPATCSVNSITLNLTIAANLASADFDSDGLDDLALTQFACAVNPCTDPNQLIGNVGVFLNRGSDFEDSADQTLPLGGTEIRQLLNQVVAEDIDGCGGPDLAYIGAQFPEPDMDPVPVPAIKLAQLQDDVKFGVSFGTAYTSVAFNANEAPVADAGEGTLTPGGVLVGGEPTCSDPSDDAQAIRWTVVSGTATISDPTAANPLITNASPGTVLQVTCTDACGLSDTDTVTITGSLLEGSGFNCSLGLAPSMSSSAAWALGLVGLVPMLALRRRSR